MEDDRVDDDVINKRDEVVESLQIHEILSDEIN